MDSEALTAQLDERTKAAVVREAKDGATPAPKPKKRKKSKWHTWYLKQLHSWHWISAAISLIGMLLFAITGFTLNHATSIVAKPIVKEGAATLPAPLLAQLKGDHAADAPLPAHVADYLTKTVKLNPSGHAAEWSDGEVYVPLPGPGSDAWVSVDTESGAITSEHTDRGWISYLNDLHKGRNTGSVWFWFIDVFAAACIIFTITGLLLLQLHAKHRPTTWPMVGMGLVIPVIIALFFIH